MCKSQNERCDQKIKLVEETEDVWQPHFEIIVETTENTDFFQKTCSKESSNMAVEKTSE